MAVAAILAVLTGGIFARDAVPRAVDGTSIHEFLSRHWMRPLAPQGAPPATFSKLEASLAPKSCGTCHPAQQADWKTSHHARAMGPGVTGQLKELWKSDPESARLCLTCHAPLAEQQPENGPIFDMRLQSHGVVCAACHVREHRRYGPPRRQQAAPASSPTARLPHDGATRTPAFLASEFCSSCHQFGADGFALNGKLLENTYEEWKASPAAARGVQCQDCHMPDRRHLWRGIHDAEMVRSGVTITLTTDRRQYRPDDDVQARLTIANTGVGHHFPTYVTPRVVVRIALVDMHGRELRGSSEERYIGREVSLDLSREHSDTRVPAGGRFTLDYRRRLDRTTGVRLRAVVRVEPDHFYTGFFESLLNNAGAGAGEIGAALESSRQSAFEVYQRDIPLM
jgi:cytochrome c554/c'-like protein